MIHGFGDEGETCRTNRSYECVDCNRTVGIKCITVDDVIRPLPKGHKAAHAKECGREDLWDPNDPWVRSPNLLVSNCARYSSSIDSYQANQNRPIGSTTAPTIIGGSRASGITFPCFLNDLVKVVRVE